MKLMKRVTVLFLCFLMLSVIPLNAFAKINVSGSAIVVDKNTTPTITLGSCDECGSSDVHMESCSKYAVSEESGAVEVSEILDYSGSIGMYAVFDLETWTYFVISADPTIVDTYWSDTVEISSEDLSEDTVVVITDWYLDSSNRLWYKVEAAEGSTQIEVLAQYSWVFQDYTDENAAGDSLILSETNPIGSSKIEQPVGNQTIKVSGALPEGAELQVDSMTIESTQFIHDALVALGVLDDGGMGIAYDISILSGGNKVQPDGSVVVTVTGIDTSNFMDFAVYHLPNTTADDIQSAMQEGLGLPVEPDKIEVTVGDGYIEFVTDGFSTYYIVSGTGSDDALLDFGNQDTFYILRGTSVRLENVNEYNIVTIPSGDESSIEECGVSLELDDDILTFTATNNATYGEYEIEYIVGTFFGKYERTVTIHVLSLEEMLQQPGITQNVYFTVLGNSTEIPSEPIIGGGYDWYYIREDEEGYSFAQDLWNNQLGEDAIYKDTPDGFLNLDVIGNSDALEQNLQGQNVIGVIDNGWGKDTLPCIKLTDEQWHEILEQFVYNNTVYISDGKDGQTLLTSNMLEEAKNDGNPYRYKMYPYVIKLIVTGDSKPGWHVDCAIVDTQTYSVSYEYNLLPNAIIQENNDDLLKPETQFYTPGTTGVKVGVMTLGNNNVTGDTSVIIYDPDTQSTSEYKFLYWNTESDGSGISYNPDKELPAINSNVTLYAIWNYTQTSGTLKIQKTEVFEDPNDERKGKEVNYSFKVEFTNAEPGNKYPYTIYNADGTTKTANFEIASGNTISLLGGEYVIINNVPGGDVTITEKVAEGPEFVVFWNVGEATTTANGDSVTTKVTAGNQTDVVCINTYSPLVANLTITKNGAQAIDENQSFIFKVSGEGIDLNVVIHGNGSVTIKDLPIGDYTVTENAAWSWRYTVADGKGTQNITLTASGTNEVEFKNTRNLIYWLSGDNYNENQFIAKAKDEEN